MTTSICDLANFELAQGTPNIFIHLNGYREPDIDTFITQVTFRVREPIASDALRPYVQALEQAGLRVEYVLHVPTPRRRSRLREFLRRSLPRRP